MPLNSFSIKRIFLPLSVDPSVDLPGITSVHSSPSTSANFWYFQHIHFFFLSCKVSFLCPEAWFLHCSHYAFQWHSLVWHLMIISHFPRHNLWRKGNTQSYLSRTAHDPVHFLLNLPGFFFFCQWYLKAGCCLHYFVECQSCEAAADVL